MKNEKLSFPNFEGTVNTNLIIKICRPFREEYEDFPDPVPRVIEMLNLNKFAQLAVISSMLRVAEENMEGNDSVMRRINMLMLEDEDPNLALLFQHQRLLCDALLLTMNEGVLRDDMQVHYDHIDLADQVVVKAPLLPTLNFMDLPSLENTGGRTDFERGMQQMLNKYDRNGYYRQFYRPNNIDSS